MKKLLVVVVFFIVLISSSYCIGYEELLIDTHFGPEEQIKGVAAASDGKVFVLTDTNIRDPHFYLYTFEKTSDASTPYKLLEERYEFDRNQIKNPNCFSSPIGMTCSPNGKKIWVANNFCFARSGPSHSKNYYCLYEKRDNDSNIIVRSLETHPLSIALPDEKDGYVLDDSGSIYSLKDPKSPIFEKNITNPSIKAITCEKTGEKLYYIDNDGNIKLFNRLDKTIVDMGSIGKSSPIGLKLSPNESRLFVFYSNSFFMYGIDGLYEVTTKNPISLGNCCVLDNSSIIYAYGSNLFLVRPCQ